MQERGCPGRGLGMGVDEVLQGGASDKFHGVHGAAYDVGHLQESGSTVQECIDGHFVGGIQDAGNVATSPDRLKSVSEQREAIEVRSLECEIREL